MKTIKDTAYKNSQMKKTSSMLKVVTLLGFTFFLVIIGAKDVFSQCANNSAGTIYPNASWQYTGYYGSMPYWTFTGVAGGVYSFSNCDATAEDTYMRVYDASWNQLAYNDDYGPYCSSSNASLDWTCTSGGTYYVAICHYSCSNLSNTQRLTYKAVIPEMTVPTSSYNSYTTCSGHLYDSGGSAGGYNNSQDGYTIIYPGSSNMKAQLTGSYTTESGWDYVYIYDGAGTGGTLLFSGSGSGSIGTIVSSGANVPLTVRFTSDGSVTSTGFDFTISCVCVPSAAGVYGSGSWLSYGYNGQDLNTYVGRITGITQTWNNLSANWGSNGATTECGSTNTDYFSTRHMMNYNFTAGIYSIYYSTDDGVRISTDGGSSWNIVNAWDNTTHSGTVYVYLSGSTNIIADQRENAGGAAITVTITPQCYISPTYGSSVWNTYGYNGSDLNTLYGQVTGITNTWNNLSGSWGSGAPTTNCLSMPADNFSTRSMMNYNFTSGYYQFTYSSDDGIRISTNSGASWNVINYWDNTTHSGSIMVYLSGSTNLIVDQREIAGSANVGLTITSLCANTNGGTIYPSDCYPQDASYSAGTMTMWSFSATAGYSYHFSLNSTAGAEDTYLHLYDGTGAQIASNDDGGIGTAAHVDWTCSTGGTYYISATHLSCTNITTAGYLTYWTTYNGTYAALEAYLYPSTSWQNTAYSNGYYYYYYFSATANNTYDFSLCGSSEDTYMRLYNSTWDQLASNDDNGPHCSGTPASLSWTSPSDGYYIVQVNHYTCSPFTSSGNLSYRICTPSAPSPVTASPSTTCSGSTSYLNATSAGNNINWYTASSGGTYLGTSASGANFGVAPTSTTTYYAESASTGTTSCTSLTRTPVTVTVDQTAPTYNGYSNVAGYSYYDGTNYWVNGGDVLTIDIQHSDNVDVREQYFTFCHDCTPNGCAAPNEIKSYTTEGVFTDWMANDSYLNITGASVVAGAWASTSITNRWSTTVPVSCPDWDWYPYTYLYDWCNNGTGYTALGKYIKVDNTAPTRDEVTVNSSCWATDGTNTYTITIKATEPRSGIGGTYGMMALVNYHLGETLAGGYFAWHPTSYVHGANQMACTGGGYVSKATNWGGTRIDLISATTSVTGNQRTVVFTVRPHSDYIELDAVNKISMYTTDYCGNVGGWTLFDANFSTMRVPSTPTGAATICTGGSATLTRGNAPPTGVTYYWQTSSTGTSTAIGSGATLVASPGSTTTYYIRPYSSLGCWGQASAGVTVTVVADPTISISANYSTICTGGTVTFTQSVSGGTGTITNQWQTSPDNSTWTNWTTTTNPSASPTANTYYRCQRSATGSGCDTYTSNVVFVTVTADPYFTTNPTGATICAGGSHYMTTVAAGGTGTLTYQWQYSDNGGSTWTNATGYTAVDITASPAATRMYRNTVSGVAAHGCSVNVASSPATITVVPDPTLSVPTRTNSVICQGGSTVYSSTLSNGTGSISYQWQYSPNNSVWSNVAAGTPTGAAYTNPTSTTMTVGGITANGTYYYRLSAAVSGTGCTNPVNSTGTTVQVVSDPSISISAGATSICYGLTAGLTASGSGGTGTMTYQWQYQNGATWVNTGSNSSSYTTAALSVTTRFRCLYSSTGSGCATSTSNVVTVNVSSQSIPPLSSSANPSTLCTGGSSTLAMAVPTTVTGGLLDYTTWTVGTGSATGFSQNGATSENNRISAADPWGNTTVIWEGGNDATSDADGGWNTGTITVDNTQLYRFSVWVNRTVLGNGSFYLGTYGYNGGTNEGVIRLSDGSNNTNPYFYSGALPVTNEWVLVVGYVYPNTYGGTTNHPESGMYTIAGGKIANTSSDYKWRPTTTATVHRTYLYYSTDISTRQRWIYPRIDLCDGTEPSINQLLNGFDSNRGLGSGASWQWYAGSCGGTSAGSGTSVVVSPTSTTNYYVRAVGTCNTTSCVNTSVTVVPDPTLSAPTRTNSIICQGGSTVYSSTLSNGTGTVTYQWQYSTDNVNYSNVVNGTPSGSSYTNPTATTMTVGGITANGTYYYRLSATTSGIGCTTPVNSTGATVQVVSDPTVAAATRTNSVVCQGGSTVYSSSVSNGTGTIAYQWQYSPDNVTFTNVVAGTPAGAAYTNPASTSMTVGGFTANGTYYYRLSATASGNGCASPVTGGASTVQVVSDPSLTAATRTNSIICAGGSSVYSSTLSNGTGTVAYQWQYSTDNVTYTNVVNGTPAGSNYTNPTAATMTVGGITVASTYYYRLSATSTGSGCTSPIVSTGSSLQVVADPTLTAATRTNSIICQGGSTVYTSSLSNGTGTVTYQWQYSADGSSFSNVVGSTPTGATYTNPTSTTMTVGGISAVGTFYYRLSATVGGVGCTSPVTSAASTVQVVADPTVAAATRTNSVVCQGGSTVYSSSVSNGTGTIAYQWQYSPDNVTFANVVAGTPAGAAYTNPASTSMTVGGFTANGTYYYRLSATASGNGCASPVTGGASTVQVVSDPSLTAATRTNSIICAGGSSVYSSTLSNGTGTVAYQWQYSTDNVTYTNVVNGTPAGSNYTNPTAATMTVGGITVASTYYYRLSATSTGSGCTSPIVSTGSSLQVVADPTLTAATRTNSIICQGGSTVYTSSLSNGTGTVTYQWQYSADGSSFSNVVGGTPTGATYTNPNTTSLTVANISLVGTYYYRLSATSTGSGCTSPAVSTAATVQVVTDPTLTAAARTNSIICQGGSTVYTSSLSNGTGTVAYQWQYSADGSSFTNVAGGTPTGATYTNPTTTSLTVANISLVGTYYYRLSATSTGSGCTSPAVSTAATVQVVADPTLTTATRTNSLICAGGSSVYSSTLSNGTGTVSYQWQYSTDNVTYTNVINGTPTGANYTNPTAASMTVGDVTQSGTYYYRLSATSTGSGCASPVYGGGSTIQVVTDPTLAAATRTNSIICQGGSTVYSSSLSNGTGTITYQWQYSADGSSFSNVVTGTPTGANYTNPTSISMTVGDISTVGTYYYRLSATSTGVGCTSPIVSAAATVQVVADPTLTAATRTNSIICQGGSTIYTSSLSNGTGTVTYQWQYSADGSSFSNVAGGTPTGATYTNPNTTSLTVANISLVGTYYYRLSATSTGSGCTSPAVSTAATVQVVTDPTLTAAARTNSIICQGGSTVYTSSLSNGTGTVAYQWQYSADGSSFTNVAGGTPTGATYTNPTTTSLTVANISLVGTYYYRLSATSTGSGCTSPAVSTAATVQVVADPTLATATRTNSIICQGGSTVYTCSLSNGTGTVSYQWQYSTDNVTYTNVINGTPTGANYTNPTAASMTVGDVTQSGTYYYRLSATSTGSGCASPVYGGGSTIQVVTDPTLAAATRTNSIICQGGSTVYTSSLFNGTGTVTYQWQYSADGSSFSNVVGGTPTGATYTNPNTTSLTVANISLVGTYYYRLSATSTGSGCTSPAVSTAATVQVVADPSVTASGATTICSGLTANLSSSGSNGTGTMSYQWQYYNGSTWVNTGTNSNSYTTQSLSVTTDFRCLYSGTGPGCTTATSNTVTVTVSTPNPSGLTSGDYVWTGAVNTDWNNASNWVAYNGTNFIVPATVPAISNDVLFTTYGTSCGVSTPTISSASGNCHDFRIDAGHTVVMSNSQTLNVQGSWTNDGTFSAGNGTVVFNGSSQQAILAGGSAFNNVTFSNTTVGTTDINIREPMIINGVALFANGVVYYTGTGSLLFGSSATSNYGAVNSYVDGIVSKAGSSSFIFPIGEGVVWAPIGIAAPSASATISADYNFTAAELNWSASYMCDESQMQYTSGVEHWNLTTSGPTPAVTLYWFDGSRSGIADLSDLAVAHFNGTCWEYMSGTTTGDALQGTITSSVAFSSYSPVSFGSKHRLNPLPIELVFFDATCNNGRTDLEWQTASEINNDYFTIEKSLNGTDFERVAVITGAGNSNAIINYYYQDITPHNGTTYYRLKQTDYDGTFVYSYMVAVECDRVDTGNPEISICPNPFTDQIIISGTGLKSDYATISIVDVLGKEYVSVPAGITDSEFSLIITLSELPPAVYFVKVKSNDYVNSIKVVKE